MSAHDDKTLRDYFAAQALNGLISRYGMDLPEFMICPIHPSQTAAHAEFCYTFADAMLLERIK